MTRLKFLSAIVCLALAPRLIGLCNPFVCQECRRAAFLMPAWMTVEQFLDEDGVQHLRAIPFMRVGYLNILNGWNKS